MALPKLYDRIIWHNDTEPALNEDNLNAMSKGLDDVDDRLIDLAGTIMEDVPQIKEDMEILGPAIENIDANVTRAETAADNAEADALKSEGFAVGTQDGVEVTSGEYYQNNAKYYAEIANPPIENTVDFTDIITISDAINKAAKDVRLKVEAVQDLHGYDKPWVGGAGKNILKLTIEQLKAFNTGGTWSGNVYTINGVAHTVQFDADGNVTGFDVNGTASGYTFFNIEIPKYDKNVQYKLVVTGATSAFTSQVVYQATQGASNIYLANVTGANTATFTMPNADVYTMWSRFYMGNGGSANHVKMQIMVCKATESSDFEPYTNICPISGWDNAKVTRSGKNLWNIKALASATHLGVTYTVNSDGTVDAVGTLTSVESVFPTSAVDAMTSYDLKPNTTYKISLGITLSATRRIEIFIKETSSSSWSQVVNQNTGTEAEFTTPSSPWYQLWIRFNATGNGTTVNEKLYPMIRESVITDATYEPYQGKELTISLNGTRYGGTLDVTTGVLTLTHAEATIDGSKVYDITSGSTTDTMGGKRITTTITNAKIVPTSQIADIISNKLAPASANDIYYASTGPNVIGVIDTGRVVLRYMGASTTADAQTALNNSPVQVVYELATPITVQLTPTQVYLLYGYNTLYGDCGDISLTYDASGIIHIDEAKLDTETLKTIAAASSDFADFKARIAAL